MSENQAKKPRLFVLDTNVLMHDPTALFRFKEHDIYLPMVVLEELDKGKKGMSEVARNVRQTSRFLDELMGHVSKETISQGIPLNTLQFNGSTDSVTGHLMFQTKPVSQDLPLSLPGNTPDNNILATALSLQSDYPEKRIVLVSKDINLRIKATVLGIRAEDYSNDQVLEDVNLLYSGLDEVAADFWEQHTKELESWQEEGRTFYRVSGPDTQSWYPSQCLYLKGDEGFQAIVREKQNESAVIELAEDYSNPKHAVWGITSRNQEQNYALNLLLDPDLDFVSLLGTAGTGKTLLTLAAGLVQTLDLNLYREIIMTRVTVPVGEDIGFLPGTEEEKMTPWMGALMDNLEVLTQTEGGEWGRAATEDLLRSRIRIHSLNFMRGRTFLNKYIILDEAQNLTPKQMKTLITRAGPGTKIVCLGNVAQIDTPYLTETTSGLTYAVDRFKNWPHSGHITLQRGERSRLADYASANL
ncbi:MAG: PhoH family protein [Candidatus Thiodiazotropha lotti]|uniref:Phosphate starvation-inducible protein PhoH n=1 Tax=Candidatus Thiodiazotropha endoloripes TaxID=1818881 RepID=A0A1E2UQB1_9GAMM|nr:PhoH family protein [Candidatus Thiodiazotropha endoloripes]MCG7898426.1 PhoH family protein [Candidatus Thiodiazotropha weberae]MCG7992318.1 PhoH family protein [Candidatus Thiodiazotropha lotti]MCG7902390.1 PhoH family protein [Candidatus Thiodiazotropha weberae]MCG7912846.1 PhoH family protein [Candidatus Thiodiazotropha weberae]MCG8000364.1 PhoH family protein [Candidatus Thiodiazotropha lotti]